MKKSELDLYVLTERKRVLHFIFNKNEFKYNIMENHFVLVSSIEICFCNVLIYAQKKNTLDTKH